MFSGMHTMEEADEFAENGRKDRVRKITRPIPMETDLWEELRKESKAQGCSIALLVRRACRQYLKLPDEVRIQGVPSRFRRVFRLMDAIDAQIGNGASQQIYLSYDNLLITIFPRWYLARDAMRTLRLMLKAVGVEAIIQEDIKKRTGTDGETKWISRDGFYLSFEHPMKSKTIRELKAQIAKKLSKEDLAEVLMHQEKMTPKVPVDVDQSKALAPDKTKKEKEAKPCNAESASTE